MAIKHTSWPVRPNQVEKKPGEEKQEIKIEEEEIPIIATQPKKKQQRRIISIQNDD